MSVNRYMAVLDRYLAVVAFRVAVQRLTALQEFVGPLSKAQRTRLHWEWLPAPDHDNTLQSPCPYWAGYAACVEEVNRIIH